MGRVFWAEDAARDWAGVRCSLEASGGHGEGVQGTWAV